VRDRENSTQGLIYDAVLDKEFCISLIDMIARRRQVRGLAGDFIAAPARSLRNARLTKVTNLEVSSMRAEQSNSSVVFGDQLILKLFRRTEQGINPDLEIGQFLTERIGFPHSPSVAGSIQYRTKAGQIA